MGQSSSDKCDNSFPKIPWVVTVENEEDLCPVTASEFWAPYITFMDNVFM